MALGRTADVLVIGGGVVGLSVALGLLRRGLSVTVLDEGDIAFRASRGNFALIWVQGKGIDSPEYARWTLQSARRWPTFAAELQHETGIDLAFEQRGGLMAALSDQELEERVGHLHRLHNQAPDTAQVQRLDRQIIRAMLPDLGPDVVGGTYCADDGHVNSLRFFRALHHAVISRGGQYVGNAAVARITAQQSTFSASTSAGEFHGQRIVLAAGLGNARLAPMIGLHAPVRPQRGQVMVTEKLAPFLAYPLGTVRQADEGGVMIGDSKEEVGYDNGTTPSILADLASRAIRTFPRLANVNVVRSWGALRVMSPDGLPIYDQSEVHPGGFVVTCHSGITLAAAHASTIAQAIASGLLPPEANAFSARRFQHVPTDRPA